ncbi:MAG: hypothetical protein NDJ19_02695 [Ramlibacter sp.]|nr:hypothetical protein [Ramlibacter sp.]
MVPSNSVPRILQQQDPSNSDPGPQPPGSKDGPPRADESGSGQREMGEGSYEATRDYQKNIKEYLKKGDVREDAEAARPRSEQEARELEQAEKEGRSHSKGER